MLLVFDRSVAAAAVATTTTAVVLIAVMPVKICECTVTTVKRDFRMMIQVESLVGAGQGAE